MLRIPPRRFLIAARVIGLLLGFGSEGADDLPKCSHAARSAGPLMASGLLEPWYVATASCGDIHTEESVMIAKSRWLLAALMLMVCGTIQASEEPKSPVTVNVSKPVELAVGEAAPAFKSIDDRGKAWDSAAHIGKDYTVIYFYPADFTGGCIKQAETFRDTMNQLTEQGVTVIGVSGDSVKNHQLFKEAWKLNYTLLADEAGEIADKFGVPKTPGGSVVPHRPDRKPLLNEAGEGFRIERQATFARWTFLIGKDGKVLYKNTKVIPANDAKQVLEFIQQDKAVSDIRSRGGKVEVDEQNPGRPVISVEMPGCRFKEEDLVLLASLPSVKTVRLGENATDASLVFFTGLKQVETLDMPGARLKGSGLVNLIGLTTLRTLNLESGNVDDAGLVQLKELKQLRSLNLGSTHVTPRGFEQLKDMTNLESLNLDFPDGSLTAESVAHLKGLTRLKTLILSGSDLSDAGLATLKDLANLETLNVEGTNVTDAGVADFQKALPKVTVLR